MFEVIAIVILFFIETIGGLFVLYLRANTYSKREADQLFRLGTTCEIMHHQTEEKLEMQVSPLKTDINEIKQALLDLTTEVKLLTRAIYESKGKKNV